MKRYLPFVIVVLVALATIGSGAMLYRAKRPHVSSIPEDKTLSAKGGTESPHIRGNPDAPVTLEEYGDFQCPPCGMFAAFLGQLEKESNCLNLTRERSDSTVISSKKTWTASRPGPGSKPITSAASRLGSILHQLCLSIISHWTRRTRTRRAFAPRSTLRWRKNRRHERMYPRITRINANKLERNIGRVSLRLDALCFGNAFVFQARIVSKIYEKTKLETSCV